MYDTSLGGFVDYAYGFANQDSGVFGIRVNGRFRFFRNRLYSRLC
jgi:hypothetical protein